MADVVLQNATKRFNDVTAVSDLSLTVADGEFVVLLGPTGAGKTTTLRLIAGLEGLDAGTIRIGGRDVSGDAPAMRDVAFVFQQYSLYPHLSVYDNMAFPLRSPTRRVPEEEIKRTIGEVARMLHIDHKLGNKATRLSGGEMQRVAIGRALVRRPAIYLMDEPLSSLDAKLRQELRLELKRIQRDLGATMLYVTHDQVEAMTLAQRMIVMNAGVMEQFGTPEEVYARPATTFVASFIGSPPMNLLKNAPGGTPGTVLGIRPEHLDMGGDGWTMQVTTVEMLGAERLVYGRVGDEPVIVRNDEGQPVPALGSSIRVTPRPDRLHRFDAATGKRL